MSVKHELILRKLAYDNIRSCRMCSIVNIDKKSSPKKIIVKRVTRLFEN